MSLLTNLRVASHLRGSMAHKPVLLRAYRATASRHQEASAKATETEKKDVAAVQTDGPKEVAKDKPKWVAPNYLDGSFHWSYERAASVALIPLISTQLLYGPHLVLDGLLGLVLPLHLHIGFEACITDYLPKRNFPRANKYASWGLKATSAAVIWGCFEFNTNDVGLTEFIQRTWTA